MTSGKCPGSGKPGRVISANRLYCEHCGHGFNTQARRMFGPRKGQPNNLPSHHRR